MRKTFVAALAAALTMAFAGSAAAAEPVEEACHAAEAVIDRFTVTGDVPCEEVGKVADGLVRDIGEFQFPPPGFAVTAVTWSMRPGDVLPSFTPPVAAASHPANWSCSTSFPAATTARAECTPTDPPDPGTTGWACYDPFVDVTITGPNLSSIGGTSSCGTSVASCTASTGLVGAGHCNNWAFPHQPVPLVCEADFGAALPASTWSVRCAPIDP